MIRLRNYAIPLCAAALLGAAPSWAQEAPSANDAGELATILEQVRQHVHEVVGQIQPDVIPEIKLVQRTQSGASKTAYLAAIESQAEALGQYTVADTYQNIFSSGMAKKTREIALLRQMLALKLTARDIEKALPLLKEMKESDKVVPVKPEQALDEEYNELLHAKPGDPMPPSSSQALRDAAGNYRSRKLVIWEKMAQAIGLEKERGIRAMLRTESTSTWFSSGPGANLFTAPSTSGRKYQFNVTPSPRIRTPAPPTLSVPRKLDAPVSALPVEGDEAPTVPGRPARPQVGQPGQPGDDAPAAPAAPARPARPRSVRPPGDPLDAPRDQGGAAASTDRDPLRSTARARAQGAPGASAGTTLIAPQARILSLSDGNGSTRRLILGYNQVSLDELIDLFERKLAAMRH